MFLQYAGSQTPRNYLPPQLTPPTYIVKSNLKKLPEK